MLPEAEGGKREGGEAARPEDGQEPAGGLGGGADAEEHDTKGRHCQQAPTWAAFEQGSGSGGAEQLAEFRQIGGGEENAAEDAEQQAHLPGADALMQKRNGEDGGKGPVSRDDGTDDSNGAKL